MKKSLMFLLGIGMAFTVAAQVKISGTVVDSDKYPLPGANVSVKGEPSRGTTTDIDGKYTIEVPSSKSTLVFSFMGYTTTEKPVGTQAAINVTMSDDLAALDEVVVVGYGTAKKSDVTGALSRVTEKQIKERPVQNAVQALQGKATGVDIVSNTRPGEVGQIRIRGNRSLTASNEPLYVIDGIPLSAGTISDLNPNDIASMEVLKDASATAIYGSRGANGVILVSTKRGTTGRLSIDYEGSFTFDRVKSMTNWMGSGEVLDYNRTAQINGNYDPASGTWANNYKGKQGAAYGNAPDPFAYYKMAGSQDYLREGVFQAFEWENGQVGGTPVLRPATAQEKAMGWGNAAGMVPLYNPNNMFDQNWTDLVTRTGVTQNHQISLSAGYENARIYMSVAILDSKSPQKDQSYSRYSMNLNGEITPKKWLTVGMRANASMSDQEYGAMDNRGDNGGAKDAYGQALNLMPYTPAYNPDGSLLITKVGPSRHNILVNMDQMKNNRRTYSLMASMFGEVRFTPWLKYHVNFGAQFRNQRYGNWRGPDATNPTNAVAMQENSAYTTQNTWLSWVVENLLYFDKTWGSHTLGVTLLQSAQKDSNENINIRSTELIFPTQLWYDQSSNLKGNPFGYGTGFRENTLMSWMARINYSLQNKYLLTVTGRYDAASVLADGHKWDFFPSAALAWKMEEENWLKDVNWINQLKLRVGYGVTGNSSVSSYSTLSKITGYGYVFGQNNALGYNPSSIENPDLKWEKTGQWNVGVDFSFLKDRLSGSLEWYMANTKDLLMNRSLPATTGFVAITQNIGATRNQGVEITLSSVNIQNPNFRWTTDLNWTWNKEEVVSLLNGKEDLVGSSLFIGRPIQVWYDYESDGIWTDSPEDREEMALYKQKGGLNFAPGMVRVKDQNGDYKIDANNDRVQRGTLRPDWTAGMTNNFSYKNWELSFFIYARVGVTYYGDNNLGRRAEGDFWSPTNQRGSYPMPRSSEKLNSYDNLLNYMDGTMVSVRNISLAYNFPERWLSKISVRRLQLYGQVLNPFQFGGKATQIGLNADDLTGWDLRGGLAGGGQTNATMRYVSWVVGLRFGL